MTNQLKLPYGLRNSQVENGLACTCPGRGTVLVARNAAANVKVAHFAHY